VKKSVKPILEQNEKQKYANVTDMYSSLKFEREVDDVEQEVNEDLQGVESLKSP
jgi:hypothetical protein